ncbi:nicotinamidase-related amidase [Metabacillus crassostreae]|uniref:cysteine hydrolase family protein n=1 Tax=Metabacillus crassostreae TaxID=929098 RepID=UPI00195EDC21|nr:cysteine hydrolase family protein [Metabacillus crassostreae]MBM7605923.1 nicotinamidase-related amidase [Metabacillus crassostreae]
MKRALIIIDVQNAFFDPSWGMRNNLQAETNINQLLSLWRESKQEVIFIQHISKNPNSLFYQKKSSSLIKEIVQPAADEKIIKKEVNSAFINTSLKEHLVKNEISDVVIVGLTTPHCVSTTTRMSGNLGFNTFLISDATASFGLYDHNDQYIDAETIQNVSLATLHKEFATVLTTDEYIRAYLGSDPKSIKNEDGT